MGNQIKNVNVNDLVFNNVENIKMVINEIANNSDNKIENMNLEVEDAYQNWRQNDSRWAKERLGGTNLSMEGAGCAITSMAILLSKAGVDNINPLILKNLLNDSLTANNGKLEWAKISEIFPNIKYEEELSKFVTNNSLEDYENIKKLVEDGHLVEIQICDKEKSGGLTHYVAVDKIENGDIYVFDPAYEGEGSIPLSTITWRDVPDLGIYAFQVYGVK